MTVSDNFEIQSFCSIMSMIDKLSEISETKDCLTRRYLTPEHRQANDLVAAWMSDAGMTVREDFVGNIIGRYEGAQCGLPAVIIGSHLDTVVDAGRYDGMLGVATGIECIRSLNERNIRLSCALEVIGFADEEGARFQSTYLGSKAVAGTFEASLLGRKDKDGISMSNAMKAFGLNPDRYKEAARIPDDVLAYLEVHIEQGPILEEEGLAAGIVTSIAGATRIRVTVEGNAGHAGTVPMDLRKDALVAAGECIITVEELACSNSPVVATVGEINVRPGAPNVIPGLVHFSVDLRAAEDVKRKELQKEIKRNFDRIAKTRGVGISSEIVHEAESVDCSPDIISRIENSMVAEGHKAFTLFSGAGHDAAAMASLTDVGMIFVRCKGGISHNPAESITAEDAITGAKILLNVLENFDA